MKSHKCFRGKKSEEAMNERYGWSERFFFSSFNKESFFSHVLMNANSQWCNNEGEKKRIE